VRHAQHVMRTHRGVVAHAHRHVAYSAAVTHTHQHAHHTRRTNMAHLDGAYAATHDGGLVPEQNWLASHVDDLLWHIVDDGCHVRTRS
jgi:hypothetical protein